MGFKTHSNVHVAAAPAGDVQSASVPLAEGPFIC